MCWHWAFSAASIRLSVSVYVSICLSVCLSIYLSFHPSFHPSIYLSSVMLHILADRTSLEQLFQRIGSVFPANHHSAIAPYSSITRQHFITLNCKLGASLLTRGHRTRKLVVIIFPNKSKTDDVQYVQRYIVAHPVDHCCHENASVRSLFVLDVDVAVGDIKVHIVAMKMQQWVRFALLWSCRI